MPLIAVLRWLLDRAGLLAVFILLVHCPWNAVAASGDHRAFDLPAGDAADTLKQFSAQARREILFPADAVDGVKTRALKGKYSVRYALDRLVAGTGLSVAEDNQTGALMIFRAAGPKLPGVAPPEKTKPTPTPQTAQRNMKRKTPLAILTTLLAAIAAPAETSQENPPKPEEPIVLSEYRVDTSRDRGYVATNATTGTRLNMTIKEIPMPVEVITRQFIDDIGAVDVKEALQYSAGIIQDSVQSSNNFTFSPSGTGQVTGALSRDSATLNIRGLNVRSFLRSGFRQDTVTDVINVDRMEIVRGPQALLYGVATLGGVANIGPKYPKGQQRTSALVGVGSSDFYRAELYNTGPVFRTENGERWLNYGVGLVYQNIGSADEYDERTRRLITPAIEFQPFENTNIFIDVEYGKFKNTGNGFKDLPDANAGNIRNALGLRVAENVNVYGETLQVGYDRFRMDRHNRLSGNDTYSKDDYFSGTIEVTQRILSNLTFVGSANYSDRLTESRVLDSQSVATVNTASPSITPTGPGVWTNVGPNPVNPAQTYWKTLSYQWAMPVRHKIIRQVRLDLNYDFMVFGNKQTLLLGRQDQTVDQSDRFTAQVTSNLANGTNRSFVAFDPEAEITYQGEQTRVFRVTPFTEWNTGHYAVYQGHWFRDKLVTIAGIRFDSYMVRTYNNTYVKADPTLPDSNVANWVAPASPDAASLNSPPGAVPVVNGYRFGGKTQHEQSPTLGASYALTRSLSLYAVTASAVFPNTGQRDGAGSPFSAENSKSKELGLKFDVWKDARDRSRISGSLGVYQMDRDNAIYNLFWAPQPRSNNQATLRAGYTGNVLKSGTGPNAYSVTSSAYTTFQTDKPVTYLLPVGYVAAADLSSPRVTGAPQLNNLILVDYASLGTAAADPLRRAMDAAANDPTNFTALQTGNTGAGAAALNANNGYINRNSDVSYSDRTEGLDVQLYFNLTDNFSSVLTYNYIKQGITGGFRVVDQPSGTEYDSWWNYMGVPLEERRGSLDESTYDFVGQVLGARTIDNPRHQIALWNKYEFLDGVLKGLNLGLGITFNGERQSVVAVNNGARDLTKVENFRRRPNFSADYKLNLGIGYQRKIGDRRWNFRVNINNLLDEQKKTAYGSSVLFIDPTTGGTVASTVAGAQRIEVPERAVRYYEPISFRFTASTLF